jgi:cysteine-S-conjugate beta-lyase
LKFATRLVDFDVSPDDPNHPMVTPIYQTATFEQEHADSFGKYDYTRSGNPTRSVLEKHLARLEGGTRAFCFSSGMAAITSVCRMLKSGDEILTDIDLYGGTCRLFTKILSRSGIGVRYADACDTEQFAKQVTPATKLVYVESPTNPLLQVLDLPKLAEIAHRNGALFCVDNSTMSPYLQNPFELGADIVLHSGTKYLSGHSDVTAGVVVVRNNQLSQEIHFLQNAEGNALGPFDSFLLLRGLKTLKLRLDQQQQNTQAVAEYLVKHPKVKKVYYPGLRSCAGFDLQRRQAKGNGAVLSFTTGNFESSRIVAEKLRLFRIAVSFGSITSTACLPSKMSHASVPAELLGARALPQDLVRLSIGIEDIDDLITDLEAALNQISI